MKYPNIYDRYKILDSRIAGATPYTLAAKVLIDQAVTAPPILATFYTGINPNYPLDSILKLLVIPSSTYFHTSFIKIFYYHRYEFDGRKRRHFCRM